MAAVCVTSTEAGHVRWAGDCVGMHARRQMQATMRQRWESASPSVSATPGAISSWRPPEIVEEINLHCFVTLGFSIVRYNTVVNVDLGCFRVKTDWTSAQTTSRKKWRRPWLCWHAFIISTRISVILDLKIIPNNSRDNARGTHIVILLIEIKREQCFVLLPNFLSKETTAPFLFRKGVLY